MPTTPSNNSRKVLDELKAIPLGDARPYNVGSTHRLPDHLLQTIAEVAIEDRLVKFKLGQWMREQGIETDGETVSGDMVLTGELRVTVSSAQEKERVALNGHAKRRRVPAR